MMKPNRPNVSKGGTYPPEFREEAVRYWLSCGQTLKSVSTDLGVTPECLRSWRRQIEASGPIATTSDQPNTPNTTSDLALALEVGQLRRELEAMTRQRDILKRLWLSVPLERHLFGRQEHERGFQVIDQLTSDRMLPIRESVKTTKSNPILPVASHLLRDTPAVQKSGQRFYSDITYIPTQEGWLYLAATLDAYSRKCVGWSAADNIKAPLVLRAAVRALSNGETADRIHRSDRGSQYASELFRDFLALEKVTQSMSRKGNCYDNAMMESFWATLKTECFDNFRHGIPATRQEAQQSIFRYIELFTNPKRLHSALGYCSPLEFETKYSILKEEHLSLLVST